MKENSLAWKGFTTTTIIIILLLLLLLLASHESRFLEMR